MKPRPIVAMAAMVFAGCASSTWQQAQHSDGLIDFVLGGSKAEMPVAVEKVSGGGGSVASAHVRAYKSGVFVSGMVRRRSIGDPPAGSHIDVIVLDAKRRRVAATAVNYLPHEIPHGKRGAIPQSHFTARLVALPPADGIVQVLFHGTPKSKCSCSDES